MFPNEQPVFILEIHPPENTITVGVITRHKQSRTSGGCQHQGGNVQKVNSGRATLTKCAFFI